MFIINLKLQKKVHHAKLFHAHELNNFVIVKAIYNNNFWIRILESQIQFLMTMSVLTILLSKIGLL